MKQRQNTSSDAFSRIPYLTFYAISAPFSMTVYAQNRADSTQERVRHLRSMENYTILPLFGAQNLRVLNGGCGAMIRVAVCDDTCEHIDTVLTLLNQYQHYRPGVRLSTYEFSSEPALLESIEKGSRYDVYLLDIILPENSSMSRTRLL